MQNPHCNLASCLTNSYTKFSELCDLWLGSFSFPNAVLYMMASLWPNVQHGGRGICSLLLPPEHGGAKQRQLDWQHFQPRLPTHSCRHGTHRTSSRYLNSRETSGIGAPGPCPLGSPSYLSVLSYGQIPRSQSSWSSNYYVSILPWIAVTSIISFFLQYYPQCPKRVSFQ